MAYEKQIWNNNDENTPLSAERLNHMENGIFAASQVENNFKNDYTVDEVAIGTWLGKTLYRKVVDVGFLPNNSTKIVTTGLNGSTVRIISMQGAARNNSNTYVTLPDTNPAGNIITGIVFNNNDSLQIETNADRSAFYGYVTLEYTKDNTFA